MLRCLNNDFSSFAGLRQIKLRIDTSLKIYKGQGLTQPMDKDRYFGMSNV